MDSYSQKAFVSIQNIEAAHLEVNGLCVLERNIRILKKRGFDVGMMNNTSDTPVIRGDCQYGLNTVEKGAGRFFDAAEMLSRQPREQVIRQLSKALFDEIYAQTEGWVARGINKKVSFALTRFLVRTSLTPNVISFLCFVIGLVGCACLLSHSWVARCTGVILIQLNSILDGCDGEVARLKVQTSSVGAWLDTILDDALNNIMYVCLFVGYFLDTHSVGVLSLCIPTALASLGVSFFLYQFMITHNTAHAAHYRLSWEKDAQEKSDSPVILSPPRRTKDPIGSGGFFSVLRRIRMTYQEGQFFQKFLKPILKRDFFIFIVMILIIFDLRLMIILVSGIAIWATFFLYLASFIYGQLSKRLNHARHV